MQSRERRNPITLHATGTDMVLSLTQGESRMSFYEFEFFYWDTQLYPGVHTVVTTNLEKALSWVSWGEGKNHRFGTS